MSGPSRSPRPPASPAAATRRTASADSRGPSPSTISAASASVAASASCSDAAWPSAQRRLTTGRAPCRSTASSTASAFAPRTTITSSSPRAGHRRQHVLEHRPAVEEVQLLDRPAEARAGARGEHDAGDAGAVGRSSSVDHPPGGSVRAMTDSLLIHADSMRDADMFVATGVPCTDPVHLHRDRRPPDHRHQRARGRGDAPRLDRRRDLDGRRLRDPRAGARRDGTAPGADGVGPPLGREGGGQRGGRAADVPRRAGRLPARARRDGDPRSRAVRGPPAAQDRSPDRGHPRGPARDRGRVRRGPRADRVRRRPAARGWSPAARR